MFTGIIEGLGEVISIESNGSNKTFWISSQLSDELKIDQSLSHNGVCLTIEKSIGGKHRVTAVLETLQKTNLDKWKAGDLVNLERCLSFNGRLDGHLVQGHVDTTAVVTQIIDLSGSWQFSFTYPDKFAGLVIEKGSISVNGTSLTIFDVSNTEFSIAVIPYTYEHTNFKTLVIGNEVNIEFDMMGKYVSRIMQLKS